MAFANIFIPKCDLAQELKAQTRQELESRLIYTAKKHYKCESAAVSLHLYRQTQNSAYLEKVFSFLKNGRYLNEFTKLLTHLTANEIEQLPMEKILGEQVEMYATFITKKGTNPNSQFTYHGHSLSLFDEIELAFTFYQDQYPQSDLNDLIKQKLIQLKDNRLYTELSHIEFYLDRISQGDYATDRFYSLLNEFSKNSNSKYSDRTIFALIQLLMHSNLKDKKIEAEKLYTLFSSKRAGRKLKKKLVKSYGKVFNDTETYNRDILISSLLQKRVSPSIDLSSQQNSNELSVMGGKEQEQMVYLPLNSQASDHINAVDVLTRLGAVGILMAFDRPIMDAIQNNHTSLLDGIAAFGNMFGETTALVPTVLGSFAVGLVFDNDQAKDVAVASLSSVILGQLVVEVMKSATHRQRPANSDSPYVFDGPDWTSGNTSFPSGHSAAAWSIATVFAEEFKDQYKWSPYVAYGIAAMTSYARMNYNRHWASDVVLGALVGHYSAKFAIKWYRKHLQDSVHQIQLSPLIGSSMGIGVTIQRRVWEAIDQWPVENLIQLHAKLVGDENLEPLYSTFRVN